MNKQCDQNSTLSLRWTKGEHVSYFYVLRFPKKTQSSMNTHIIADSSLQWTLMSSLHMNAAFIKLSRTYNNNKESPNKKHIHYTLHITHTMRIRSYSIIISMRIWFTNKTITIQFSTFFRHFFARFGFWCIS